MIRSIQKCALLMLALVCALAPPIAAKPGGADNGVDVMPVLAAISMPGHLDAVSADGSTWHLVADNLVADAIAEADVTTLVDTGESTYLLVGSMSSALEAAVTATLAASPPVSAPETHPKPSRDEYKLKKTIITSGGKEKDIFKTLVVEKRAGETGAEFQRRSERELGDALDAGWTSTP